MAERNLLGARVRAIRESRALTVDQLADRAGVKAALIGQVESGSLIPSLAPLIRIARALGVRMGTFLDDEENVGPVVARAGEQRQLVRFSGKDRPSHSDLDFFSLAANKANRHMEPFLITVHPSSAQAPKPSVHEGEEFVYVLSGEIEVSYGKESHRLVSGDAIYYDSIVPHDVHAGGAEEAVILAVVYAPS